MSSGKNENFINACNISFWKFNFFLLFSFYYFVSISEKTVNFKHLGSIKVNSILKFKDQLVKIFGRHSDCHHLVY